MVIIGRISIGTRQLLVISGLCIVILLILNTSLSTAAPRVKANAGKISLTDSANGLMFAMSDITQLNTDAVLYVHYDDDPRSRLNLQFFLAHGLHSKADFYFIINGYNLTVEIPPASHIHVIKRENTCYDLGTFGTVLQANNSALIKKYKRFILMNSTIRGPFFPNWARLAKQACWSNQLFAPLSDLTKLVGLSANCDPKYRPRHLQSFALATDSIGLQALLPALKCFTDRNDAIINGESMLTQKVRDAGYNAVPLYAAYADAGRSRQSNAAFWDGCEHDDVFFPENYFGIDVHPFDTLFTKTLRQSGGWRSDPFSPVGTKALQRLTEWADQSGFSSEDEC